jgi:hypothetical protein
MNIKEKIKLYEENIKKNKILGYKKQEINKNNIRRKVDHWNNIKNKNESENENIEIKKDNKTENIEIKKNNKTENIEIEKNNEESDETEIESYIINM